MPVHTTICFIANDYKFFFRHFAPAIAAARACKFKILAYLPEAHPLNSEGSSDVQIIPSPINRFWTIWALIYQTLWLIRNLRQHKPEVVVAFSVRTALALALALPFIRPSRAIIYVTGLGLLALRSDRKSKILRAVSYAVLRAASRHRNCYFIFENDSDPISIGFRRGHPVRQITLVGAGVDTTEFTPRDLPPLQPFKIATVSRLVWSKGIDLAVRAISELVQEGHSIELSIYGAPDESNPLSIAPETWKDIPGINFRGHTEDVAKVWAEHHAAIFASRGGEGVPRSLLESAACGRASIVTNVPGCAEFIRDRVEGYVVSAESVESIKKAVRKLLEQPALLATMGEAARRRVLETSTLDIVQSKYKEIFGHCDRQSSVDFDGVVSNEKSLID